jgi:hypothetical protein
LIPHSSTGQTEKFINPTGVYKFCGKTFRRNGETYGYFGDVKVLFLHTEKILVNFFICKGAPSYNSGSFIDTLSYKNNIAVYTGDTSIDRSCKLTFYFTAVGINVNLQSDNPNFACGFGHAVDAQGYYRKIKGKKPTKEEILKATD